MYILSGLRFVLSGCKPCSGSVRFHCTQEAPDCVLIHACIITSGSHSFDPYLMSEGCSCAHENLLLPPPLSFRLPFTGFSAHSSRISNHILTCNLVSQRVASQTCLSTDGRLLRRPYAPTHLDCSRCVHTLTPQLLTILLALRSLRALDFYRFFLFNPPSSYGPSTRRHSASHSQHAIT